jgi:hypothetical protein
VESGDGVVERVRVLGEGGSGGGVRGTWFTPRAGRGRCAAIASTYGGLLRARCK